METCSQANRYYLPTGFIKSRVTNSAIPILGQRRKPDSSLKTDLQEENDQEFTYYYKRIVTQIRGITIKKH